jgi:hypothetical protein
VHVPCLLANRDKEGRSTQRDSAATQMEPKYIVARIFKFGDACKANKSPQTTARRRLAQDKAELARRDV